MGKGIKRKMGEGREMEREREREMIVGLGRGTIEQERLKRAAYLLLQLRIQ